VQAVLEAARLRLRPIVMTSIAFIMGVLPLAFAHGAGQEVRRAMGAAVLSGMIGVTVFGLMLTPVFYVLLQRERAARAALPAPQEEVPSHA
jgi:multidrug efflux pump